MERRKGQQFFYIMGGNKVAPPGKNKGAPQTTGKVYSGKPAASTNNGPGAGPKKFGSSMGVSGAEVKMLE